MPLPPYSAASAVRGRLPEPAARHTDPIACRHGSAVENGPETSVLPEGVFRRRLTTLCWGVIASPIHSNPKDQKSRMGRAASSGTVG